MRLALNMFGVEVTFVDSDPEYDFEACSDEDLQRIIDDNASAEDENPSALSRQAWHEQMVRDVRR